MTDKTNPQRYCLVSDDHGHDYVIEVEHRDEWYELDDDTINDGPEWAWQVGGAPEQVTFTDPEIFGQPVERSASTATGSPAGVTELGEPCANPDCPGGGTAVGGVRL